MISFIVHLIVIAAVCGVGYLIGYAVGWKKAFEYSDHLDNLDDKDDDDY